MFESFSIMVSKYNLNLSTFLWIYFFSIIPIYLGIFLSLYGSLKKVKISNVLRLNFKEVDLRSNETKIGLVIFVSGFLLPYLYIFIFGRGLSIFFYFGMSLVLIVSLSMIFRKILSSKTDQVDLEQKIEKHGIIADAKFQVALWKIYDSSFGEKNKESTCQQSIETFEVFKDEMLRDSVKKYIIYIENKIVGMGMITNNLSDCTWISKKYFEKNYPNYYHKKKLYYFMGIAIDHPNRRQGLAKKVLEYIIDDLPKDAAMGFDHSHEANRFIPYFNKIVKQRKRLKKKYLDKQLYYLVTLDKD